jgi:hypothetical protein
LERLGKILSESNTFYYAWALMPNHFHLLIFEKGRCPSLQGYQKGKERRKIDGRSILCYWATDRLGISYKEMAKPSRLTQPAVTQGVRRGKDLVKSKKLSLFPETKL